MQRSAKAAPTTLDKFWACCEPRAHLYSVGELDLQDAINVLQDAVPHDLVDAIGEDAVQAIIVEASIACARGSGPP